jgi:hypothetical protein
MAVSHGTETVYFGTAGSEHPANVYAVFTRTSCSHNRPGVK